MRTILVTGGAGFIGSHMVDRLIENGDSVIVLDNLSSGLRANVHPYAHFIQGDITDMAAVERAFAEPIDAVLHIAGQASTIRSFSAPHEDLLINVSGTINVLTYCMRHRVPRLLFASSMTVYGDVQTTPIAETTPCAPFSYYGIAKYAAERYVLATSMRNDLDAPLQATAFRMFNVYGPRQRLDNPYQGVLGYFIGNVLRHEPIEIHGDGHQSRDFVNIADVVDAWLGALDNPAAFGQVFNLGYGVPISINQLARMVIEAAGKDPATHPILRGKLRPGDQRHMVADINAARAVIGWHPAISLPDGLPITLAWAQQSAAGSA